MAESLRAYRARAAVHPGSTRMDIALERSRHSITRWSEPVLPPEACTRAETVRHVERVVKFLLWSRGGGVLHLSGPGFLVQALSDAYQPDGARGFDARLMSRVYDRPFEVAVHATAASMPAECEAAESIGGHLDGCRIGFDLGASDFKLAAVRDGEVVFSAEIPWNPVGEPDPAYHRKCLEDGLRLAATHLPRVDAIGGSSAGIYVDNQVKVASLFRSVPADVFAREVKPMFLDLQRRWDVPLVVVNDGDVTALAGAMSLGRRPLLGIAMGSSEAAGYIDPAGNIKGWLNELAFAPVDVRPDAPRDEWSGDLGVGALYFSQQAVKRLAPAAGISVPDDLPVPKVLSYIQSLATGGDPCALGIFETIGWYLGHTLALYREFYAFDDVLVLGRVLSGVGGDTLLDRARRILDGCGDREARPISIHVPDETNRRVGQAVAAASLPRITRA